MEQAQIRNTILAAFAALPVPQPRTLLGQIDRRNRASAEKFRKQLAGKTWQSLSPGFLKKGWSAYFYLSPEAYRYYLPALLMQALQDFTAESSFLHSVVFGLRPSFWELYYNGEDADMRAQQSAFTPEQYRAVCLFLGEVFDQIPNLRHLSAQALHWGWNQYDTPALQAANAYYEEMRSFIYPPTTDPEKAALRREIETAFASTPYPGDNQLCGCDQGDEPAEYAMDLRGVKWQSAHPELLARSYAALSFLSEDGFRYFLPAFLMADLFGYELGYESNANPIFDLTRGLYDTHRDKIDIEDFSAFIDTAGIEIGEKRISREEIKKMLQRHNEQSQNFDWQAYAIKRLQPFNREERLAIIRYLEYCTRDEYDAPKIKEALKRYWIPSVQSSNRL